MRRNMNNRSNSNRRMNNKERTQGKEFEKVEEKEFKSKEKKNPKDFKDKNRSNSNFKRNDKNNRNFKRENKEERKSFEERKFAEKKNVIVESKEPKEKEIFDDQVEGRNSVLELIESGKDINKIFVVKGEKHGSINKILAKAKEKRIIVVEKDRRQMEEMAQNENYQGIIAIVPPFEYSEIEEIIEEAKTRNEDPFVLVLDGIEDPHNLGSIIRTAETAGVHGVIIPKRRAATVNSTVNKVSAGAVEHMKVARVTNISETIEKLKQQGLWICGTDINTDKYHYNQDLTGPLAIVIGNEGCGMSEKVKKNCDFLVKIPMKGKITSLNAAVSTGIVVYESVKQRIK